MPTTPYAQLLVSVDGGAPASGGQTAAAGDVLAFSFASTVGWGNPPARVQIYAFPAGFSCPAGWTTAATTINGQTVSVYEHVGNTVPDAFALPASPWFGKLLFRLIVLGGSTAALVDEASGVTVTSVSGIVDVAFLEAAQFDAVRPGGVGAFQTLTRKVETLAGGGGGGGLTLTTVKTAYYEATIGELVRVDASAGDLTIVAPTAIGHAGEQWGVLRVEGTLPSAHVVTISAEDGVNEEGSRILTESRTCTVMRSSGTTWLVQTEHLDSTAGTATPQGVGTMGNAGTSHGIAREDHVHALGFPAVQSALSGASSPVGFGSQRITGLADGVAASDAATVGQLGGASIVAPSPSALLWVLNEATSPFAQSNKPLTSLDMTLTGAGEMSFAAPLGDGVWLPSGGVTLNTADTAEGEADDWTWHWWGNGGAQSSDYCGVGKVAVTGAAFAIALQVDAGGAPAVLFHRHSGSTASTTISELRLKRALMDGAWHHVALSFDGSVDLKFRFYVDGSLVWTSAAQGAVVDWGDHRGYYVPGTYGIQRITLEPTVLTLAAIREIATRGLGWAQP